MKVYVRCIYFFDIDQYDVVSATLNTTYARADTERLEFLLYGGFFSVIVDTLHFFLNFFLNLQVDLNNDVISNYRDAHGFVMKGVRQLTQRPKGCWFKSCFGSFDVVDCVFLDKTLFLHCRSSRSFNG